MAGTQHAPEHPTPIEVFSDALAALLDEGAGVFLAGIRETGEASTTSTWAHDRQAWAEAYETDDVVGWVVETAGIYLAETAHLLRAFATLLRSRRIFATMDLIVRAVIERVGHVNWILDDGITSEQRAARAGLEFAACFFMYRESLHWLEADTEVRSELRGEAKAQQQQLEQRFSIDRPPDNKCDENSPPTGDVRRWVVGGESFPDLGASATYALKPGGIGEMAAKGTYAALSGFSHPNVVFSREHRDIDAGLRITFRYERQEIEKAVRMALFSFAESVKQWVRYYDAKQEQVNARLDDIAERLVTCQLEALRLSALTAEQ